MERLHEDIEEQAEVPAALGRPEEGPHPADGLRWLDVAEVVDDGRGLPAGGAVAPAGGSSSSGFGMTVMRERAARWGGTVRVRQPAAGGTAVRLTLPLPASLPTVPAAERTVAP